MSDLHRDVASVDTVHQIFEIHVELVFEQIVVFVLIGTNQSSDLEVEGEDFFSEETFSVFSVPAVDTHTPVVI